MLQRSRKHWLWGRIHPRCLLVCPNLLHRVILHPNPLYSPSNTMLLPCLNTDDCRQQGERPGSCQILRTLKHWAQFVVSGAHFSMNFLLLCIQSLVCVTCVAVAKRLDIISFRAFDLQDAKAWFPISFLLVSVIYTGSKSLVSPILPVRALALMVSSEVAIFEHTSVYHLQELDNHTYCELSLVAT
jgi:hypothetical protein